jgi:hypothetical protein
MSFQSGHFLRSLPTQILAYFVQPFCYYYTTLHMDQYNTIMWGHITDNEPFGWGCACVVACYAIRSLVHNSNINSQINLLCILQLCYKI